MALQKQGYNFNFAKGLDTKTDPNQVEAGKFLVLENSTFVDGVSLSKREGFADVTKLPVTTQSKISTFSDSLVSTGTNLYAYNANNDKWINKGSALPVNLSTTNIISTSAAQTACDSQTASNGLICTTFMEAGAAYYQINDRISGSVIVQKTALPSSAINAKVFILDKYFIITFMTTAPSFQFISIPIANVANPSAAVTIGAPAASSSAHDGYVANGRLFVAWNASDGGGAVRIVYITSTLFVSGAVVLATQVADLLSVTADISGSSPVIWVSWYRTSTGVSRHAAFNYANMSTLLGVTTGINTAVVTQLTSVAKAGILYYYYQVTNTYSYTPNNRSDIVRKNTLTQAGVLGTASDVLRSVGIASKPFYADSGSTYLLYAYNGTLEPTYFLGDSTGNLVAKLAFANGNGYISSFVLPSISVYADAYEISYLYKNTVQAQNRSETSTQSAIYSTTGVKVASFTLESAKQYNYELAGSLHLTGGFLWQYDGSLPVEHSFHLYPEDITVTTSGVGGLITAQQYYYQVCYEWTDAAGNLHRSAPSIPVGVVTIGATSSNTINIPTLRLTYKSSVRIVVYRWSTAQQNYYQITNIASPTLNNKTVDSIAYVDTLADSAILGNTLIYTTGGVIENIAAPACNHGTMFKDRLALIDAENPNTVWYSKVTIQNVPVEFSDQFTVYVSPTSGAQGSTGKLSALSAIDDKLIMFKNAASYYLVGNGPDNTGANNDFSEPTFITSTVGTDNPDSIVFMPMGLMFQSDKGLWALDRSLNSSYIGADVQAYNDDVVVSALSIPATNEVRFNLLNGVILVYDYFYQQWGTYNGNIQSVSACLWTGYHTLLNQFGQIRRQTPNVYLDGASPVLQKFTTSWFKLTGLQGFQRAQSMVLLAKYLTPHKITIDIAYDYNPSPSQTTVISPENYSAPYGSDSVYGASSPYGGPSDVEQERIFFDRQKCQSIQLTVTESYDPTLGAMAGAGFVMSGINLVIAGKDTKPRLAASQSTG